MRAPRMCQHAGCRGIVHKQPSSGKHAHMRGKPLRAIAPTTATEATPASDATSGPVPTPTPPAAPPTPPAAPADPVFTHLAQRMATVTKEFPAALSVGDFMCRTEIALSHYGFRGDNSIAITNLCRDEATAVLKSKIERVFGSNLNINGLGGVLTCGCIGLRAGFSHSPIVGDRERYIFFSMPHVAIDPDGRIGVLHRPGRPDDPSIACGALISILNDFKSDQRAVERCARGGATASHAVSDPELSILRQKLARHLHKSGTDVSQLYLTEFTKIAERVISADLENLIRNTVDVSTADYAVVTGVQVHSWAQADSGCPALEFVAPRLAYVVQGGARTDLNLQDIPALTPRQLAVLRNTSRSPLAAASVGTTTVVESRVVDRRWQ